jgi:crotonobetainyl-CoA:carnitine CoA-transferase CaiB-like acyl-CoA transferase
MADSAAPVAGPLAGLRVVDCSTVLAGPFCTMLLADLGADVVKVEPPDGDGTRGWGPPWVGSEADGTRTAAYYLAANRNKRSIRLDLRQDGARGVLRRLIEEGDVLVENFRTGGLARLGFDEPTLERLNPALVHLAISGYGPDGPDAAKPGYDFILQAVGGLMSITGAPAEAGGEPTKVGVAISDVASGLFGAVAVLAALLERERATPTGGRRGQRIDVSLLGSTLALLVNQAQNAFVGGQPPTRRGNTHPNIVPYETFGTADGVLAVGVGSERQWARFCAALDLAAVATDGRFVTNGDRVEHRAALRSILAARLAAESTAELVARLDAAGVPCGPINDIAAAFTTPAARARRMRLTVDHPRLGPLDQVGVPVELSRTPASIRTAPPLLGEHTDEILDELGYGEAYVAALRASGAI